MTEKQREAFKEKLKEYFEYLKKQIIKEEQNKELDYWGNKLFYRYIYGKNESNNKSKLPKEHVETMEKMLKEINITSNEYLETKGRTQTIIGLMKKNEQQKEEQTLEELIKLREQCEIEIIKIKREITFSHKIHNLTKEETEKKEQQKQLMEQKRKKLNEKISKLEQEEKEQPIEQKEQPTKEKIEELKRKKNEIKIEKIIQDTTPTEDIISKYQQKQQKYQEKQTIDAREAKKEIILKLLCRNEEITIKEIEIALTQRKLDTEDIISIIKDLRIEIPGIVKRIKEDGKSFTYAIKTSANEYLEEYKTLEPCPKIYEKNEGTFSFIVRSDLHLNMTSSRDTIRKMMNPYLEYCAAKENMPIIDLGDLADTRRPFVIKDWENHDKEAIKQAYNFFKNYAQALNMAPEIKHYTLFGNHEDHPYLAGVDPIEIIYDYSKNFYLLGVGKGKFKIANDKIAVYHDKTWQNVIPATEQPDKEKRDEYIYKFLCEHMKKIASDYVYSLIGHYHFGKINPSENFAVINNGIETALMFTAEIKDNEIQKMFVKNIYTNNNQIQTSDYEIEIYNKEKKYNK